MASELKFDSWQTTAGLTNSTVVQTLFTANKTALTTSTTSSYTDVDTITITPTTVGSKILIFANYGVMGSGSMRVTRNGTAISSSPTAGSAYMHYDYVTGSTASGVDSGSLRKQFTMLFYDSPATTSAVTYKTQFIAYQGNTGFTGFAVNYGSPYNGVFAGFMVMEVLN